MSAPGSRRVYRYDELRRVFAPSSVALVGASPNPGSIAYLAMKNMRLFAGPLNLVNAKHTAIDGVPCYPSVRDIPEVPDCVVIAVGRESVEPIVRDCAERGVGGVVIFAAGYAETALPDRVEEQQRLTAIARESGLRIVGPNCVGLLNHAKRLAMSFSPDVALSAPSEVGIGLVSQSGGVGNGLTQALHRGIAFSHTLATGNSSDIDCADCVAYLAGEPDCRAIALIFEGLAAPERLLQAGELAWKANKPLIVFKLGRAAQGAQAALSHTGFMAGSAAAYKAALERVGAVVVDRAEALIETAAFFAKAPAPKAYGVAVVGSSGGTIVHGADEAELAGVPLPPLGEDSAAAIRALVPEFATVRNPLDITTSPHGNKRLIECIEVLLRDPAYGAIVAPHNYCFAAGMDKFEPLGRLSRESGKPIVLNWISEWIEGQGAKEGHTDPALTPFRSTSDAFQALAAWLRRGRLRERGLGGVERRVAEADVAAAKALLDQATASVLTEREAKRVLARYGLPVAAEALAADADAAVAAAKAIGLPVAMKIESPDIAHKTDIDAVRLGCKTEADVRSAYAEIVANARAAAPRAKLNGVLVQAMAGRGVEVMVGARLDPQFGPLVLVGLGGAMVEAINDSAVALAPVGKAEALDMLDRLRGRAIFDGFRGIAPVDRDALAEAVCRISELIADHRERIAEIDVNPLICNGKNIVAVDALIALASGGTK